MKPRKGMHIYVHGKRFCEIWDRDWDVWASVKFTGPKYGMPSADGKSAIWIDRVVLVRPDAAETREMKTAP